MTRREEQIESAVPVEYSAEEASIWKSGVCWADNNPESKYNLSDTDYIKTILDSIVSISERTTSGNVAHNIASIKGLATAALNTITKL